MILLWRSVHYLQITNYQDLGSTFDTRALHSIERTRARIESWLVDHIS